MTYTVSGGALNSAQSNPISWKRSHQQENRKKNKMSSDMRSVRDLKVSS